MMDDENLKNGGTAEGNKRAGKVETRNYSKQ